MEYRRLLTVVAVVMVVVGTATALSPPFFAAYTGFPVSEEMAQICQQHEQVKMSLVRLNGSMNMGVGLMAWVLRPVLDAGLQKRILLVFLVGTAAGMCCVVMEQFTGTVTGYAKVAVLFNAAVFLLVGSGVVRLHREETRGGL